MTPTEKAWAEWENDHADDLAMIKNLMDKGHDKDCAVGTAWGFQHCICERGNNDRRQQKTGRGVKGRA